MPSARERKPDVTHVFTPTSAFSNSSNKIYRMFVIPRSFFVEHLNFISSDKTRIYRTDVCGRVKSSLEPLADIDTHSVGCVELRIRGFDVSSRSCTFCFALGLFSFLLVSEKDELMM